jgi:hypothetical protein
VTYSWGPTTNCGAHIGRRRGKVGPGLYAMLSKGHSVAQWDLVQVYALTPLACDSGRTGSVA